MSIKASPASSTADSSSPDESNVEYLPPTFLHERDDKGWRLYFANPDVAVSSPMMNHVAHHDEGLSGPLGFLYDYYGMAEESRQDPPSPGHKSSGSHLVSSDDSVLHQSSHHSESVTIPERQNHEKHPVEMRHSFPEDARSALIAIGSSEVSKRSHSLSSSNIKPEHSYSNNQKSGSASSPPSLSSSGELCNSPEVLMRVHFPYHPGRNPFHPDDRYVFILEAQTSVIQRRDEDSLTYLNKGQFYNVTFETHGIACESEKVKSVIHLVFRDEKDPINELAHWAYWHAQQPNPNQRAFDIDRKACQNIDDNIEEIGYNAMAFLWCPRNRAKVSLRINCLSTDFSPQKGVKGIPLHLQIDTYEDLSTGNVDPVFRAFCQIKVFRDKGAERKNKDESKTAEKRMMKFIKQTPVPGKPSGVQQNLASLFQGSSKVTILHSASPLEQKSVVFVPKLQALTTGPPSPVESTGKDYFSQLRERESKRGFSAALAHAKEDLEDLSVIPKLKNARTFLRRKAPVVTIYVRKEEEKAYNALMLDSLTLEDLKKSVAAKYGIPCEMIKKVLKKTKKGLLVNFDDQLVEQFVDEDDFLISIEFDNQMGHFDLVFR